MSKKYFFLGPIMGLILVAVSALPKEDLIISVHLFKGAWVEGHPGLKEVTVMTTASHPAIEALKAKLDAPQEQLTAAIIDALIETQDLKTIDEYFTRAEKWNGRIGAFSYDIKHKFYYFRFTFNPNRYSPQSIELKLSLYKSKETSFQENTSHKKNPAEPLKISKSGARMDKLLDDKFLLDLDNPIIIGMPSGEETFFMMIYVRRDSEKIGPEVSKAMNSGGKPAAPIDPPKEVHTLIPAYPEELRSQGVQGQVGLQVTIDDKGEVIQVKVVKPLHPYLDFAAVQAIRQWKYDPAVQSGKPIPVMVDVTMNFDPETYRLFEERALEQAEMTKKEGLFQGSTLEKVLDSTANYCRKLSQASLNFICEETIKEIHYNFATEPKWIGLRTSSSRTGQIISMSWFPQWDPMRTIKSDYVCDYLFVRKGDRLQEQRIILSENGRKTADRSKFLEEKRFTALNPVLAAAQLLDHDRQALYNFRLIEKENISGREAFVIEAIPKSGNTWGVEYAKIWIDQQSYQVLKSEIQGVPLEGYDDVLKDAVQFRVRPYLLTTHTYDIKKNGIRFPDRSTIRVEYPRLGDFNKDRTLKLKIDMTYKKYQFFTIETRENLRK